MAIKFMQSMEKDVKGEAKQILKNVLGDKGYTIAKKMIKG